MATVQAGLRLLGPDLDRPDVPLARLDLAGATARLDRLVAESTEPHQFVTLAWAVVDASTGEAVYVVAGHPAPRVVRASGAVESLGAGGPLLGVVPGAAFAAGTVALAPGDTLVLYTDGLSEAPGADGAEFGDGLDAALAAAAAGTAEATLARLVAAHAAFASGADAEADDLTLVAVRRAT
jgi:sigma-B regulation protein RsbU (phosphoserine phosphatase)